MVGLAAADLRRGVLALSAVTALASVSGTVLATPTRPFDGLPTVAPESWSTRVPWLADSLVTVFSAALLAALVATVIRAVRADRTERRHLLNCAAVTSMGVGLVVMCVALAALRDPGDIDPATGSVGYLVAMAITAALAAYGTAAARWPLWTVIGYWATAVAILVGVFASSVRPILLGVALTVLVAAAVTAGAAGAAVWLHRWLTPEEPTPVVNVPTLTPRENEVLAAVAAGSTNAGIAAQLFLSERTIEQHLRSIFAKLQLGEHDSSNRRVRAASIWWQHQMARERDPA